MALETVYLNAIEVFQSGIHNGDRYTDADLDAMIEAFDKVGFRPTVKKVFGASALGYVSKLYRNGDKLIADLVDVPKHFAELVKAGSYKRASSEIYWNFCQENENKKWPRVYKSLAFLGAEIPALPSLGALTKTVIPKPKTPPRLALILPAKRVARAITFED